MVNYLEEFKRRIKSQGNDLSSVNYCLLLSCDGLLLSCDGCPLNKKCVGDDFGIIEKRNKMILDYVNIHDNLDRW